jgi:amino acid adenylation domain-containing protein
MVKFRIPAFVDILQSILSKSEQTLTSAVQVGEGELEELWTWNEIVPPTIESCMHDIIVAKAIEHPDKPAVISWDGELTYGQLSHLSCRFAEQLCRLGVGAGSLVVLCFEKSMWTSVGLLSVMRAGGTVVLIDPSQPEARLSTIVQEVQAKFILTSRRHAGLGSRIGPDAQTVVVDSGLWQSSKETSPFSLPSVSSYSLFYIIFTSGSTGKPKGITISHANFTTGAIPRAEAVGYKSHSRVLDFPSYAFDVSLDCMLCTLSVGGCICVPSEDQRLNDLNGAIKSMSVNMAHLTPSVARLLSLDTLASLEVLGLGGESLSTSDALTWSKTTKLIIAYGPSECTVGCTINNNVHVDRSYTSIGKAVGGVTWIVDPDDHNLLTPIGGVGELLVEGGIVGVGYLNDPEKTSEAFIEDPKWLLSGSKGKPGRGGRLYKTGDLVKYDPDGSGDICFVGRKDRQVKLRGQRVELAEIEHHLLTKLPEGSQVAADVITPGSKAREPMLVTFVSEHKSKQPQLNFEGLPFSSELCKCLADINRYLTEVLPRYMIPTAYIPLPTMPLLVSCKIDRKRIQDIGLSMTLQQLAKYAIGTVENQKPQTETELILQKMWMNLLGEGLQIGTSDSFFALGGDSLKAMKLVVAARNHGLSLTVAQIFSSPTLSQMASNMVRINYEGVEEVPPFSLLVVGWKEDNARAEIASLCSLAPEDVEDIYPCTPLQEGFMALSAKVEDAYIARRVLEVPSLSAAHRLKAAFADISPTSPILRTRIVQVPGRGLMQVVVRGDLSWALSDNLDEYLSQDSKKQMALGDALARFAIIQNDEKGKVHLVMTIHHALYDGWSMPLIVHRINKAYNGVRTEEPMPFKAFIKYLQTTDLATSAEFWKDHLQGATGQQFPTLPFPGYRPQADSLLEHYTHLPCTSSSYTTLAVAIRAAWALIAAQYTACNDPIFGETLSGRDSAVLEVEEIEGPLITTVPMRIHVDWGSKIPEYLQTVHEQAILRIPHQHMGLQHIRRLSPDAFHACELRTGIVLHPNAEQTQTKKRDLEQNPADGFVPANDIEAAREALKFNSYALMLVCSIDGGGFLTMASFDSKTVGIPHMKNILNEFGRTVKELSAGTESELSSLQFLKPLGPQRIGDVSADSLPRSDNKELNLSEEYLNTAWIRDPQDPAHLLPQCVIDEPFTDDAVVAKSSIRPPSMPNGAFERLLDNAYGQSCLCATERFKNYGGNGALEYLSKKEESTFVNGLDRQDDPVTTNNAPLSVATLDQLRRLWSRILNVPETEIGPKSNFFALGGDSIAVMKLVSEIRMQGFELTVADAFAHKQLDRMMHNLTVAAHPQEKSSKITPFSTLHAIDKNSFVSHVIQPLLGRPDWKIVDVLPARPLQNIAVKGTTQLPRYSVRYELVHFHSPVDRVRLFKSIQELVSCNEILRTVFVRHDGNCYAVVLEDLRAPIEELHIDGDVVKFSRKLCNLDIQTRVPLGLEFIKFFLVEGDAGKRSLIVKISHAQYDEICLSNLLQQLSALYEGRPIKPAVPFSLYVYHIMGENIPQSISYWSDLLKGSSLTILRPDIVRNSNRICSINKTFEITGRNKDITIATLPTAAWALTLARRLSIRDVTFGEVVSGRNLNFPYCDMVMGPTWQYIPIRVKFEENWTALELLYFIQQQHIESSRFEGMGMNEIIQNCTNWPDTVDWFDSVVHQAVDQVTDLSFLSASSQLETVYPHSEPLREWKIQAFSKDGTMTIEIVTFEDWLDFATLLFEDLGNSMEQLINSPDSSLFKGVLEDHAPSGINLIPNGGHTKIDANANIDAAVDLKGIPC